jgi:NitT/TauT family transport system permease protein
MPRTEARSSAVLEEEIAGLERLQTAPAGGRRRSKGMWARAWPALAAAAITLALWQVLFASGWRPPYVFPSPERVLQRLGENGFIRDVIRSTGRTLLRAGAGFSLALVVGTVVGVAVARFRVVRSAVGSLIAGLQTMPSIAWFPLAIMLFQLSEAAILFVVVLGAAPAIANGLISGIDHTPPVLLRAGRVMGARGLGALRHVVLPAAVPGYIAGVKQGWAFAWRSLMAGELIVIIPGKLSLGALLQFSQTQNDAPGLVATMLVILVLGIAVDALVFGRLELAVRRRRGLVELAGGVRP